MRRSLIHLVVPALAVALAIPALPVLSAVETPAGAPAPAAPAAGKRGPEATPVPPPPPKPFEFVKTKRPDVFIDLVAMERAAMQSQLIKVAAAPKESTTATVTLEQVYAAADEAARRANAAVTKKSWDEAIRIADEWTAKKADWDRFSPGLIPKDDARLAGLMQMIANAKTQSIEARDFEEARAAFDALNLKVEGILWSADSPSVAIIAGEPKAVGINDRVRGCTIKRIEENRVDFQFSFKRKLYDFQRYVGDDF